MRFGPFLLIFAASLWGSSLDVEVSAKSAILMDAQTGAILYEKNAHELIYPGSTTKIASALHVLELKGDALHEVATATQDAIGWAPKAMMADPNRAGPSHWLERGGTHMDIKKGEKLTLETLLIGHVLQSANDASNVMAEHLSGSNATFMEGVNQRLREIGCENTNFVNPHGLHRPEHQTTAYEMGLIMRELIQHEKFRQIAGLCVADRPETNLSPPARIAQFNRLMKPGKYHYPKAIAGKSGFHELAGRCLVSAAEHDGRTLIAGVFGCEKNADRFEDTIKLFDAGFAEEKTEVVLLKAGPQPYIREFEQGGKVKTVLARDLVYTQYPSAPAPVKGLVEWASLTPPIEKGEQIGIVRALNTDGIELCSAPLFATRGLKASSSHNIRQKIDDSSSLRTMVKLGAIVGVFFLIVGLFYLRSPKRRSRR